MGVEYKEMLETLAVNGLLLWGVGLKRREMGVSGESNQPSARSVGATRRDRLRSGAGDPEGSDDLSDLEERVPFVMASDPEGSDDRETRSDGQQDRLSWANSDGTWPHLVWMHRWEGWEPVRVRPF
ncbi:hypothetical protein ACP275_07G078100 [Erythranthe tilingii]